MYAAMIQDSVGMREVIVNDDSVSSVTSTSFEGLIPPKTAKQKLARKNELKAKSTLMLAIPDEHLLKFLACKDAKSLWEAIKNRFGGNKESKKMQKTILKKNYENFAASSQEGLDKTLIAWNNIALIMRNKSDLNTLSMDDLYNNMKVYESKIKSQSSLSLKSQNVAFVSSNNTSSTNETVNTAHGVSADSPKDQASIASYVDDVIWMLTIRVKRFIKKKGRKLDLNGKDTIGFDRTKVECYNCHRRGHFAREYRAPRNQGNKNRDAPTRNAPVFKKGEGYHAVPPPYTRNYMPARVDLSFAGLDNSVFKSKVSENITSVLKIETNASKTSKDSLEKPKTIWSSKPIIEDWESDSEDENVFEPKEGKITGPKETRPVWDNTARVNHQNKLTHLHLKRNYVPATVLTKSGQVPVNTAKQSSHRVATSVSTAMRVNTAASRPHMNNDLPTTYSYFKAHSPDQGIFDSGCSRHMTGNKSYLIDYQEIDGGFVAFGGNAKGELKFNLISVSNMCDKKNSVLFTDTECVVLSPDFKLLDESQVLLKVPRNNNMYSFDLKNVVPIGGLTCLFAKAILDESNLWHRRLGHINFKTMNKLVRGNLARENQTNGNADTKANIDVRQARKKTVLGPQYVLLQLLTSDSKGPKSSEDEIADDAGKKSTEVLRKENGVHDRAKEGDKNDQEKDLRNQEESFRKQFEQESKRLFGQGEAANTNNTNRLNTVSSSFTTVDPGRERTQRNEFESTFGQDKDANDNKMFTPVSTAGSTYDYLGGSILDSGIFSGAYDDRVEEPEKVIQALTDPSWIEAMQDELLQFRLQKVWRLVDLPKGKHAIGTKWVNRNKKDERRIIVRNKVRLVAQGYTQEEGINCDEVFAPVARIEAI
nr:ribonuclease H-like domain-containing protein [Tanacetum cinerariifolium]